MTNMQQLYAAHLENVKHNREMERLTEQQNQTERDKASEQKRHNEESERLSKYQADTSAAATRYTADQRNEGTHYQADTSLQGTKYSADTSQENTKIKGRYDVRTTQLDNATKEKLTKSTNYVTATGNWLRFINDYNSNVSQRMQAQAAVKNADYNAIKILTEKTLNQAQTKKVRSETVQKEIQSADTLLSILGKLFKAAGSLVSGETQ